MKRTERIELTRSLLDDGRLTRRDISKLVGRSERWVKNIARQYPRSSTIQVVYPPEPVRNRAIILDEPSGESTASDVIWCWVNRIAGFAILILCVFAAPHYARFKAEASNGARKRNPFVRHSPELNGKDTLTWHHQLRGNRGNQRRPRPTHFPSALVVRTATPRSTRAKAYSSPFTRSSTSPGADTKAAIAGRLPSSVDRDPEILTLGANPKRDEQLRSAQAHLQRGGSIKNKRLRRSGGAYYLVDGKP